MTKVHSSNLPRLTAWNYYTRSSRTQHKTTDSEHTESSKLLSTRTPCRLSSSKRVFKSDVKFTFFPKQWSHTSLHKRVRVKKGKGSSKPEKNHLLQRTNFRGTILFLPVLSASHRFVFSPDPSSLLSVLCTGRPSSSRGGSRERGRGRKKGRERENEKERVQGESKAENYGGFYTIPRDSSL